MNLTDRIGFYLGQLTLAWRRSPGAIVAIAAICVLLSFAMRAVLDPLEVVRLHRLLGHGPDWPAGFGEIVAFAAVGVLALTLYGTLIGFYRRIAGVVPLWPAILIIGGVGNTLWWYSWQFFDVAGALCGVAPMAIVIFTEQRAMARLFGSDSAAWDYDHARDRMFGG